MVRGAGDERHTTCLGGMCKPTPPVHFRSPRVGAPGRARGRRTSDEAVSLPWYSRVASLATDSGRAATAYGEGAGGMGGTHLSLGWVRGGMGHRAGRGGAGGGSAAQ